jgi:hypothetical protein
MLHLLRVVVEPTRQQRQSTRCSEAARKVSHQADDFKKSVWPLFLDGVTPTGQWHGAVIKVRGSPIPSIFLHTLHGF